MRRLAVAIFTSGLVALLGLPAGGAGPSQVRIREAALDAGGQVRLVVSVTGEAAAKTLAPRAFR